MANNKRSMAGWALVALGVLILLAVASGSGQQADQGGSAVVGVVLLGAGWLLVRKGKKAPQPIVQNDNGVEVHIRYQQEGAAPRTFFKKTYTLQADYFVHTPLATLLAEGKTASVNSTDDLPPYDGGSWIPPGEIWGHRCDLEKSLNDKQLKEYKIFLMEFRKVCEGPGAYAERLAGLKALEKREDTKKWYNAAKRGYADSSLIFPDLALWYDLASSLHCDVHQAAVLIANGYETLEQVAEADFDAIKKLPRFGPKSTPKVLNHARQKAGLPELSL